MPEPRDTTYNVGAVKQVEHPKPGLTTVNPSNAWVDPSNAWKAPVTPGALWTDDSPPAIIVDPRVVPDAPVIDPREAVMARLDNIDKQRCRGMHIQSSKPVLAGSSGTVQVWLD